MSNSRWIVRFPQMTNSWSEHRELTLISLSRSLLKAFRTFLVVSTSTWILWHTIRDWSTLPDLTKAGSSLFCVRWTNLDHPERLQWRPYGGLCCRGILHGSAMGFVFDWTFTLGKSEWWSGWTLDESFPKMALSESKWKVSRWADWLWDQILITTGRLAYLPAGRSSPSCSRV